MKLELKHLDFVNNGKVRLTRLPHWDFENINLQDCELHFTSADKEPYLRYKDVTFGLDQIKVYKLPLSSLTKEIEHNGEKFVPIEWLQRNIKSDLDIYKPSQFTLPLEIEITTEDYSQTIDLYNGYLIVQKLAEWHIDFQNLIEQGLAIDLNTVKN